MHINTVVLGGGPGGYSTAIRLSQYGIETALIEADRLGGTCLIRGCIPTKSILKSSKVFSLIKNSENFGIRSVVPMVDMEQVVLRKNKIVDNLVKGLDMLMIKNNIKVFNDYGIIQNENTIKLQNSGEEISFDNLVIATGSQVSFPASIPVDGKRIITSDEALDIKELPTSLLIIGGGVIGCEFASIYSAFGVPVTICEMTPSLLPFMDSEITRSFTLSLKKKKVKVIVNAQAIIDKTEESSVFVNINGKIEEFSHVLVSTGRKPNLNGFGLEKLNIKTDRFIEVNRQMQTIIPNVYAIGDITGHYQLAHCASAQGMVCASNIAGKVCEMDYSAVPSAVYTNPGLASVGINEEEAKQKGIDYKTGKFPLQACGKAQAEGEPEGMVKVIVDSQTETILGIHMIGSGVYEMISEGVIMVQNKLNLSQVTKCIHPHPTISESVFEALENIHGMAINIINK